MRYLITGGAGFIGSHLAETLLRQGHEVVILDDLCTGSIHNIEALKHRRGFSYVIDSIFNRPLLAELIDDCDAVFHLAASVGVRLIVESPVRTIETNVKGTEGVSEFAGKKKKKVLIASTSEVYGKSHQDSFLRRRRPGHGRHPKGAGATPAQGHRRVSGPRVLEGEGSAGGDRAAFQYRRAAPDRPLRHGAAQFRARGARAAQPLTVFGDGKQSRCFCHVSDTVGALARLIEHPEAVGRDIQYRQRGRDHHRQVSPGWSSR